MPTIAGFVTTTIAVVAYELAGQVQEVDATETYALAIIAALAFLAMLGDSRKSIARAAAFLNGAALWGAVILLVPLGLWLSCVAALLAVVVLCVLTACGVVSLTSTDIASN